MPHLPRPAAQRQSLILAVAFALLLVLASVTAVQSDKRVANNLRTHSPATVNDLARWTELLPHMLHDHAAYDGDAFPYPPITLALMAPVTWVPQPAAQVLWALCKIPLIVLIFWLVTRIVRAAAGPDHPIHPLALALVLFAWLWPIVGDFQQGQTNLLMLLPLVAGLRLLQRPTAPAQLAAGLLIALAVSIKVTPLIFLPYVVLQRRWIALASALAGLLLWLLLVPAALFGWNQNLTWLSQWTHIMILPYVQHAQIQYSTGQSLPSFLARLLQHIPAYQTPGTLPADPKVDHFINLLDLPAATVHMLTRCLLLAAALAGAFWMRKPLATFRSPTYLLHLAALACFMLWASERTWIHHYVTLLIPLMTLAWIVSQPRLSPRARTLGYAALTLTALTLLFTSDAAHLFGHNAGDTIRAAGLPLLASILLLIATLSLGRNISAAPTPVA